MRQAVDMMRDYQKQGYCEGEMLKTTHLRGADFIIIPERGH